jgi:MOSC domain-containing protein YiiM
MTANCHSSLMQIRHLYISPGHNYFGHHGRAPGEHSVVECSEIRCVPGLGVVGDRFFDYKPEYGGQITFFAWEVYEALGRKLAVPDKPPSVLRRTVITAGVDLNGLIGREFDVQGVRFRGTEECKPCYWMNQAFAPGAEEFLRGNGGLRAAILTGGTLRKDAA